MVNILRGDLSVVGPRPEQPHVVAELAGKIPFYRLRHLVRPGLTGWAQVKYQYAGTEAETLEKLQYEFFYLRRQSLGLDLRIVGRTCAQRRRARGPMTASVLRTNSARVTREEGDQGRACRRRDQDMDLHHGMECGRDYGRENVMGISVLPNVAPGGASRPIVSCPICGADTELWVKGLGSAIQGNSVDGYRCPDCRSIVSWPLVVPDGLYDAIYRNAQHLPGYCRYVRYARGCESADDALGYLANQEDVYWAVAQVLASRPESRSWRIVEIGSGLGYLTAAV